jgi:molybdate transport system substrate-binding protein
MATLIQLRFRSFVRCAVMAVAALVLGGRLAVADPLVVFAAASLKEPLDSLAAQFGDVVVSYGGSGMLARQIAEGAPADLVILAAPEWIDELQAGGHLVPESRVDLLSNTLVLVAGSDSAVPLTPEGIAAARGDGRIAMGIVTSVPAGIYGKQALDALGLWDGVKNSLAEVDNVRAALALVARGEAPLGIVYRTDALVEPAVHLVATFPDASHAPILYVMARTATSGNPAATAFAQSLADPAGQAVFAAAGFIPLGPTQ